MHYFLSLCFFVLTLFAAVTRAETLYIDDTLLVPLRAGESLEYKIVHKGVKSGTPVKILSRNNSTGYVYVETPEGIKGYMPARFLTDTPIARVRLETVQKQLETASKKYKDVQQSYDQLKTEFDVIAQNHKKTTDENSTLSEELNRIRTISSNAVTLDSRNKELYEENEKLRSEVELLTAENQHLKNNSDTDYMIIGGGLVVLGIFIALITPMLRPTKKHDNWV